MSNKLRKVPELLGQALTPLLLNISASGETSLDFEDLGPWLAANNLPDPAARLVGAIVLLFAGSLSLLVVGYVIDSTRANQDRPRLDAEA